MTVKKAQNKKTQSNDKKKDPKNAKKQHVNKNCLVYMCDKNAKLSDGKTEEQVMNELEEIFTNSMSKYEMIGDVSQNRFALLANGYR